MKSQMPSSNSIQDLPVATRAKLVPPSPQTQTQPPPAPASRIDIHIMSVIHTMKHQERSTVYKPLPYLENAAVSAQDRQKLYHWGTTVLDACEVDRHLATVAITFFDGFLGHRDLRSVEVCLASEREFQLAYITCLVIALKCRKCMRIAPSFVAETICEGMYYPEEFVDMEIEILRTLGWRLNGPTPQDFIPHFVSLLPSSTDDAVVEMLVKEANQTADIVMRDYDTAMGSYSLIALTSILISISQNVGSVEGFGSIDVNRWMNIISRVL